MQKKISFFLLVVTSILFLPISGSAAIKSTNCSYLNIDDKSTVEVETPEGWQECDPPNIENAFSQWKSTKDNATCFLFLSTNSIDSIEETYQSIPFILGLTDSLLDDVYPEQSWKTKDMANGSNWYFTLSAIPIKEKTVLAGVHAFSLAPNCHVMLVIEGTSKESIIDNCDLFADAVTLWVTQ